MEDDAAGEDDAGSDAADLDGAPGGAPGPAPTAAATPARRGRSRRAVVAVVVLVVVLVAGGLARHAASGGDDAGPAPLDGSATASELFPVLAQEATASAFPDADLVTALRVVPASTHRLAVTPAAVYWVAQDASGGVCLLARELAGEGSSGGACSAAADIARTPLTLPSGSGGAALVPRGRR